jgi:hypothetical protein
MYTLNKNKEYKRFVSEMDKEVKRRPLNNDKLQAKQVNTLVKLERAFRRALIRHPAGLSVYSDFIEQTSILGARPYFRERDVKFKAEISVALKNHDALALTRFDVNYQFIRFAMKCRDWSLDAKGWKILQWVEKIKELREDLIVMNMPLSVNQARAFAGMNQKSHLEHLDFQMAAAQGLISAVDKFCGPWSKVFRAVVIGRAKGNMIEHNSASLIHFYPTDKKLLYRIRKMLRRLPVDAAVDYDEIHRDLNHMEATAECKIPQKPTEKDHMMSVLAASQVVSGSDVSMEYKGPRCQSMLEQFADDMDRQPDRLAERSELYGEVPLLIAGLPILDQKVLSMRGVCFG